MKSLWRTGNKIWTLHHESKPPLGVLQPSAQCTVTARGLWPAGQSLALTASPCFYFSPHLCSCSQVCCLDVCSTAIAANWKESGLQTRGRGREHATLFPPSSPISLRLTYSRLFMFSPEKNLAWQAVNGASALIDDVSVLKWGVKFCLVRPLCTHTQSLLQEERKKMTLRRTAFGFDLSKVTCLIS